MTKGDLSESLLEASSRAYGADPKNRLACNALTSSDWEKVVASRDAVRSINHSFSRRLLPDMKSTSQRQSGRCWLFAVLNVMRRDMQKKYNLGDDFELSQTYLFFWDKLEKCNYFLENVMATADEDVDGRLVSHLLDDPICDGGQWDMIVNVVEKYGVVPKSVFPDVEPAKFTRRMNRFLLFQLRDYARELRGMLREGGSTDDVRARKEEMMVAVYRIVAIHLGEPPKAFDWRAHDKDKKKYLAHADQTPLGFYREHVPTNVADMVCIVNDPRNPYGRTLTVRMLGNVHGGRDVLYLNLSIEDLISYAKGAIDGEDPVWFGCDVGAESNVKGHGLMSTELWDYDAVFGTSPQLSKADRLRYGQSLMTHAMVLTGYDQGDVDAEPSQWRVENSWGDDHGDKGYAVMTGGWFREYVYEVAVRRSALSEGHRSALSEEPIVLPPWDPMGALASTL